MGGMARLCRAYGSIWAGGVRYVWDYVGDCAVKESEMPSGSDRWMASERAKYAHIVPLPPTTPAGPQAMEGEE